MDTNVHPQRLTKFLNAMKTVYGPIDALSPADAASWTPPPLAEGHRGRYLWTDAFGVLNLLTLSVLDSSSSEGRLTYTTLAARLIAAVHDILGRTRDGTRRLPGASDAHPLAGRLRIGKEADEDEDGPGGDGDGDGQYHHYLTPWMFALNRMARASGERRYNDLAVELAQAIHPPRVREGPRRGAPKGVLEDERGLATRGRELRGGFGPDRLEHGLLQRDNEGDRRGVLERETGEYRRIAESKWRRYGSDDPLDLGMTLWSLDRALVGREGGGVVEEGPHPPP